MSQRKLRSRSAKRLGMTVMALRAERRRLRKVASRRQKFLCHWCKEPMRKDGKKGEPNSVTLEHLVPQWVGGEDTEANTVAACERCNNERGGAMTPPATAKPQERTL